MTTLFLFGLLICVFVTASFVDTYSIKYNDDNIENQDEDQDQSNMLDLLEALQEHSANNKENRRNTEDEFENWTGRWMPARPNDPTPPPKVLPKNEQHYYEYVTDFPHEMYMGHVSPECDDAKTNLTIDWDYSPSEYTCYGHNIVPNVRYKPNLYCENISKAYKAAHKCMNQIIEYDEDVPIYGPHRPLWPAYGEYIYVPKQRWLHNLEHGAIVMLYHPCADPLEVKRLKSIVNKCLWRHIISPYSYLDEDRPLALLSWGCRLSMSYVNPTVVKRFIREKALRGPEQIPDDGYFQDGLLTRSDIVTNALDSVLCPDI